MSPMVTTGHTCYKWSHLVITGHIWSPLSHLVTTGHLWSHLATQGHIWSHMPHLVTHGHIWSADEAPLAFEYNSRAKERTNKGEKKEETGITILAFASHASKKHPSIVSANLSFLTINCVVEHILRIPYYGRILRIQNIEMSLSLQISEGYAKLRFVCVSRLFVE